MISPVVFNVLSILLITSLIVLFLFIMYRNLLRKMKMRIPKDKFAFLEKIKTDEFGIPTSVLIEMPVTGEVELEILPEGGQPVRVFLKELGSGKHDVPLGKTNLNPGNYILRMTTSNQRSERKFWVRS